MSCFFTEENGFECFCFSFYNDLEKKMKKTFKNLFAEFFRTG